MICKNKRWIGIVAAAVVLLTTAIGVLVYVQHTTDLYDLQQEALDELDRTAGQYDTQSIVLQNTSKAKAEKLAKLYGAELRITKDGKFATLTLPEGTTIRDAYASEESVLYIKEMSADYQVRISDLVDEEDAPERLPLRPQYSLSDADYDKQTYLDYLNIQNAWDSYTGSGVTVAIIDTGIDTDHPEFAGRISEYSYNATEDKIVKDYVGANGSYDWSLIEDEQGHGTAVTGVIAASMNSGNVVGIAPKVNIIVIKAECDEKGTFKRTSDLVFGLYYAIERDVQVVNMSFGITNDPQNPFAEATQLAYDSDIICVAAAGNDSTAALSWPAADENVIGVGALGAGGWELAEYSNYGENVNMVAPGTTYTTLKNGKYGSQSGTSFAAPITTGAIALYMQSDKYATFDKVTEILYASCADLGDLGRDWYYGFGALDVYAFTKETRGTITYDMLTDELENQEGLFISGHTLQEMPEPERLYAVFDGWYYDDTFTQEYVYYEDKFYDDLTLYAKWVNEDDGLPYTYVILDDGTVEIRSYTGHRRYITIPEKIDGRVVSSIGEEAFKGQTRLREVTLPSGLIQIRREAFAGCVNLMTINVPSNVVTIDEKAFAENVRLYTVAFVGNSRLETIGDFAFAHCSSLEQMELPTKLEEINGSAFYGATALRSITVQKGNKNFTSYDGVLYNFTGGTLVAFPASRSDSYTLLNNTHTVGSYAFAYAKVKTVDLAKVKQFEDFAFIYSQLEEVEIPHNIKTLGVGVFSYNYSLMRVSLGDKLTEVTKETFYYCTSLHEIVIPQNIVSIGESAFAGSGLTQVAFAPNSSLVRIGDKAFLDCGIHSVSIPDSVTIIGDDAFSALKYSYSPVEEVVITENSQLRTIGDGAFRKCFGLTQIYLPQKLETICSLAFANTGLATVTVPASVTTLGAGAFAHNASLSEILVETKNNSYYSVDGVVYTKDNTRLIQYPGGKVSTQYTVNAQTRVVAAYAFAGTVYLTNAVLPEGMEILSENSFCDAGIQSVSLPTTMTEIQAYAFYRCGNLKKLSIPDNVTQIGRFAVAECWSLTNVTFNTTAKLPRISYGAFAYSGLQSFTVPANVSTMAQGAFEGCKNLTSFTFAENSKLESISAYMFDGCTNLKTITFKSGSALTSIQAHGLEGMDKLTSIDFGDAKLTNIDNFAFRFCESLSTLTIPNTLTNIGRYAFYGCKNVAELSVPETMEHIGSYAFLGTKDVEVYFAGETLPLHLDENWDHGIKGYYTGVRSVATSGDYKYAVLTSGNIAILEYLGNDTAVDLTAVDLGAPITIIGGSAFEDSTVTSIVLPSSLTTIQAEAFRYAELEEITIPAKVTFIGREAFAHTRLNTLTFADGSQLSVMEQCAFEGTKHLREVILPASLQTMGTGAFRESGLESVTFAEGILLTEIPQQAFASTKLTALALPDSVILVNHNAFNNVTTLQSVTFGRNEGIRLMSNAFYHTGLTSLHIPANVTYIGEYCFVALSDLTEFTVDAANPNYTAVDGLLMNKNARKLIAVPAGRTGSLTVPLSVEEIGFGAFEESQLSEVLFDKDANILTLGYRAFFKVENITEIHIPASVVSIDYYAFAYCENLQTVAFAEDNQLKGIYEGAFAGCIRLEDIMLPDSIVEISDFAFYGCSSLTEIPVSNTDNLKGIYSYAFAYTGISGELTTPANLYDIGDYAFMGTQVTKVTVPDTMQKQLIIGIGVFEKCNQLEEITLPFIGASFEDEEISWFGYIFGAGAYSANETYVPESLKTVTITEGITTIYEGGFAHCAGLEAIKLPHSISVLYTMAFYENTAKYELTNTISVWEGYVNKSHFGEGLYGSLVLSDSVTGIGDWAFYNTTDLISVIIPESVTDIGVCAFRNCTKLAYIRIPNSVTSFSDASLPNTTVVDIADDNPNYQCIDGIVYDKPATKIVHKYYRIEEVVIPDGITELGYFGDCTNLTSVVLPNSITSIGANAFKGCSSLVNIHIPDSVTSIESRAFANCSSLTSIILPDSVTSIGDSAFSGCKNLTSIVLPDKVTSIAGFAFYGCSSLINITIPNSVTSIGNSAFYGCSGLTSVALPENLTNIGSALFYGCAKLSDIAIPNNVNSIGDSAFFDCSALTDIRIPNSVTSIGTSAFYGCSSLTNIHIPDSVISISNSAFSSCSSLTSIILPDSVTSIGDSAFSGCKNLTSIVLPDSVTSIGVHAFSWCSSLASITISQNLTTIGTYAFFNCDRLIEIHNRSSLKLEMGSESNEFLAYYAYVIIDSDGNKIYRESGNGFEYIHTADEFLFRKQNDSYTLVAYLGDEKTITLPQFIDGHVYEINSFRGGVNVILPQGTAFIGDGAFSGCSTLKNICIPDSVITIGNYAFNDCTNLESVTVPESVTSIGVFAFSGNTEVTFLGDTPSFQWIDGILYDNPITKIIYAPKDIEGDVIIPDGITYIDWETFYGCTQLTGVVIPEGVTSIGTRAFFECSNLKKVVIAGSVKSIGMSAFEYCSSLTDVALSDGIEYISNYAFSDCTSLTSIRIPDSVTSIESRAFSWCSSLTSVNIPDGITSISDETFLYCRSLTSVDISDSVTSIGDSAFCGCSSLTNIHIPDSVTSISESVFQGCHKLTSITIPDNVTSIGDHAFSGCSALTSIHIPDSVLSIGNGAFAGALSSVTIPKNVTSIGDGAFNLGISMEVSPENTHFQSVDGVVYDKPATKIIAISSNVTDVTILDGVTSIEGMAFYSHKNLRSITIPDSVTSIGSYAFYGCENLRRVDMGNGVTKIEEYTFAQCSFLQNVLFSNRLIQIDTFAFLSCWNLYYLVLPDSLTTIGRSAFSNCSRLTSITIPKDVTLIDNGAFDGCFDLGVVFNNSDLELSIGSQDNGFVVYNAKVLVNKDKVKMYRSDDAETSYVCTEDDFCFEATNETYTLIAYLGDREQITLPRHINGRNYKIYNFVGGKDVVIPDGITKIDDFAFWGCGSLTSITIPDTVTTIGQSAFTACGGLTDVRIPESVVEIGQEAFDGTPILENSANQQNGVIIIDGWLHDVDESLSLLPSIKNILGVVGSTNYGAYTNCDLLKNAVWGGAPLPSNIEALYITRLNSATPTLQNLPITLKNIVICDTVGATDLRYCQNFLQKVTGVTVYVEALEQDLRWDDNFPDWNNGNRVVYGDQWTWVNFYNEKGMLIHSEPRLNNQVIRLPIYEIEPDEQFAYELIGWDVDDDGKADSIPVTMVTDLDATALVKEIPRVHKITFMDEGGNVYLAQTLSYGTTLIAPPQPTRKGYVFLGWNGFSEGMTAETDVVFRALWEHEEGGHVWSDEVVVAATCIDDGYTYTMCTICDEEQRYRFIPAVGHTLGELQVIQAPSCIEEGAGTQICQRCGDTTDVNLPAEGHRFVETVQKNPSCTEYGQSQCVCSVCQLTVTEDISLQDHDYVKKTATKPWLERMAENLVDVYFGYDNNEPYYFACSDCGHIRTVSEQKVMGGTSALSGCSHVPGAWILMSSAACGEAGVEGQYCVSCEKVLSIRVCAEAIEHDYTSVVTAPTCTEQGYTTHTCHCGDSYVDSYVPATGHSYGSWYVTDEPTCTEKGEQRRDCENCDHFEIDEVAALGHDLTQHKAQAPTCTEIGWNAYETCSRCDHTTYAAIPAIGHDYKAVVTEPTCVLRGYTTHTCAHCDDRYVDTYVSATGHSYGEWVVITEPSCWEKGEQRRECENCDHFEVGEVAALSHDLTQHKAQAPTCTEIGWNAYETCSRCDYTTYVEIPASGHDHKATATAPTCTEQGYTTHTCHCGDSYVDTYVPATGHSYGEWVVTDEPACLEKGEQRRDCANCGHFETEEVAALGHKLTQHAAKAPTCTEIGWDAYETCSRCDHTTYEEIEAIGHNYKVVVTAPTCTQQGYTTHTCHCGDSYVDSYVDAKGHSYSAATCTKAKTCKVCGATSGKKLGHTYSNDCDKSCNRCKATRTVPAHSYKKVVATKATLTKDGKVKNVCTECGYTASKTTVIYKASKVSLSKTTYTYNGRAQKPSVTVKDSKGKTISSKYYTVTYAGGRKNVGTYKVTVKFKGSYSGTKALSFKINPPKTTVKSLTAGTKKLTVNITKKSTQVTGYQIQYSTGKTFKTYKSKNVTSYKTTKATLTGLKAKKTYYVRVRTYKTVNGVKYYSGWSTVKYKKTK